MINAEGGINGRKINFISYDDGYSPPKTVEQARKLVESDEVLLIFQRLGTPSNSAIQNYMNAKKVPQLFVATGATKFGDPQNFPWTMGWQPNYQSEARIYAKYILKNYPNGKIAALYQNDDYGKDLIKGLKDGLGDKASRSSPTNPTKSPIRPSIRRSSRCRIPAPTSSSPWRRRSSRRRRSARSPSLAGSRCIFSTTSRTRWRRCSSRPASTMPRASCRRAYLKDPTDPTWKNDPGIKEWLAFMDKYFPTATRPTSTTSMAMRRRRRWSRC